MTLYWQFGILDAALIIPFVGFIMIGFAAIRVLREPGDGIKPSDKAERAIMWSSIGEGIGLFVASNIVMNLHHPELLLPAMALVVKGRISFRSRALPRSRRFMLLVPH